MDRKIQIMQKNEDGPCAGNQTAGRKGLPFPGCYWVVPGKFLAGRCPLGKDRSETIRNLESLIACGIRHVINLMDEQEIDRQGKPFPDYDAELALVAGKLGCTVGHRRIPIREPIPSRETAGNILDEIESNLLKDRPVYLHCWRGKGRTGVIVGCYLVRQGMDGEEALHRITLLRGDVTEQNPSPELESQRNIIRTWKD